MEARRHDVDWLRNLALGLLILYHIGMYYVFEWGWHIKSEHQSELLQNAMVWSNLWRMCLLFFVSGMTLALVDKKYSSSALLKTRFKRLFVPLLFGMFIIVPPQLYYELLANNQISTGYWQFWSQYIDMDTELLSERHSIIGLLTWNHLWYLSYLFCYTLIFLAIRPLLQKTATSKGFHSIQYRYLVALAFLFLLIAWVFVRPKFPTTHGLTDDWWSHIKYLPIMLFGYFFAYRTDLWQYVLVHRRKMLIGGLCTYGLIALDRNGAFPDMAELFQQNLSVQFAYGAIVIGNMWFWLMAMVGYAGRYLNKPSKLLNYCNEAVLPWYVLHQSLIIIIAANLVVFSLPVWLEVTLILLLTFLLCYTGYEVVRRFNGLRLLFGLKIKQRVADPESPVTLDR